VGSGSAWHRRRFFAGVRQGIRHVSLTPDLPLLATDRGAAFAAVLRDLLVSLHVDAVNRELRLPQYGGDYDLRPFPLPGSPVDVSDMKVRLRQAVKTSPTHDDRRLARSIQYAFMLFMFGESLPRDTLVELFRETRSIEEGLNLEFFVEAPGQSIRTNGLSLFTRCLRDGDVVHLFADTPPHFVRRMAPTPRVYAGADSYALMDRVAVFQRGAGCCVEMGSGSGIQLVGALKHHHHLTRAIGKECDRRAVNVSIFNAALNGVSDRVTIVSEDTALGAYGNADIVSFAMANPPFLAVPRQIAVGGLDSPLDLHAVFPTAGWGGEDGLEVTRQFVEEVRPLMGAKIPLVIYSQFAGDDSGPDHIRRYAERAGMDFTYEPLPSRRGPFRDPATHRVIDRWTQPVLPAAEAAATIARLIVAALVAVRHPEQFQPAIRSGAPEHGMMVEIARALEKSYARQGITRFYDGFAILTSRR